MTIAACSRSTADRHYRDRRGRERLSLATLRTQERRLSCSLRAVEAMKTYKAAGLLELQKMVDALGVGPHEDEPGPAKAKKKSGSVLDFGAWLPKMG